MGRRTDWVFRVGSRLWAPALLSAGFLVWISHSCNAQEPATEFVAGTLSDAPKLPAPLPLSKPQNAEAVGVLPIDLPTVLELARASNTEIQMASERIREAQSMLSLARMQWVPSLQVGATYMHHEGRIQDIDGTIFDASKSSLFGGGLVSLQFQPLKVAVDVLKARQTYHSRSGELDRVTRTTLQEVSLAYVDLVAAQAGAAITLEIADLIEDLRKRADEFLKQGMVTPVDVQRYRASLLSQLQKLSLAKQNQLAASSRLGQLLSLQNGVRLVTSEESLMPLLLIDENQPEEKLLEVARSQGPGLSEVVALLSGLDQQERQLRRVAMIPNINVDVGGGSFGGGFGGSLDNFNGSSDYAVRMYWDVTKIIGTSTTRELFASKRRQASMQHDQIIGKLTLGVAVARDAALKSRERIQTSESEIELAIKIYETSRNRLQAGEGSAAAIEVQQAIGTLGQARANYVSAVIDYNKAQIQLQYLVGFGSTPCVFDGKEKHRHGKRLTRMPPRIKPGPTGAFGPPVTAPANTIAPTQNPGISAPTISKPVDRSAGATTSAAGKDAARVEPAKIPLTQRPSIQQPASEAVRTAATTTSAASEPIEVISDTDPRNPPAARRK